MELLIDSPHRFNDRFARYKEILSLVTSFFGSALKFQFRSSLFFPPLPPLPPLLRKCSINGSRIYIDVYKQYSDGLIKRGVLVNSCACIRGEIKCIINRESNPRALIEESRLFDIVIGVVRTPMTRRRWNDSCRNRKRKILKRYIYRNLFEREGILETKPVRGFRSSVESLSIVLLAI